MSSSAWYDGTTIGGLRAEYDGFGRAKTTTLASTVTGQPESLESRDVYHYDVASSNAAQPDMPPARMLGRLTKTPANPQAPV